MSAGARYVADMTSEAYALPLLDYAAMVWRRRVLVVLIVTAMALPAVALSRAQTPVYEASGVLLLSQQRLDTEFNIQDADLTDRQMDARVRLILGDEVAAVAARRGAGPGVTAQAQPLSNAISIQARDSDPQRAARTVNIFARAYIDVRSQQVQDTLDQAAEQLQRRIDLLAEKIDPLLRQIREARPGERARVQATVQPLQQGLQSQQATLESLQGQLEVQRALARSDAALVDPAAPPGAPVSPRPFRDGALALVLGLVLGISVAVLLETARLRRSLENRRTAQEPTRSAHARPEGLEAESQRPTLISRR